MEELINLFEDYISDDLIKEYYKSKILENTDKSELQNFLYEEIIDDMKYNQSIKRLLLFKYILSFFNDNDEILDNLLQLNLYSNKIEKKCLKLIKKSLNISTISLADIFLILELLGIIQSEMLSYNDKLLDIHELKMKGIQVIYPDNISVDKEKIEKIYTMTINVCTKKD